MPRKQAQTKGTKQPSKKTTPTTSESRREWTDREKKVILDYLVQTIQSGFLIEKPTAAIYYGRLQIQTPGLNDVTTTQIKNVVKNLKKSYDLIINWRNQTGEGIVDKEYVRDYILKKCPLFDILDEIYGTRASVNPPFIHETLGENNNIDDGEEDDVAAATDPLGKDDEELLDVTEFGSIHSGMDIEASTADNILDEVGIKSSPNALVQISGKCDSVNRKRKTPITTSMGLMAEASKQRSDLAVQRLQFEKETFDRKEKMDMQALGLQKEEFLLKKEIELGRLDIERQKNQTFHEVEMKKMALEEQRLKNEELKLRLELAKHAS